MIGLELEYFMFSLNKVNYSDNVTNTVNIMLISNMKLGNCNESLTFNEVNSDTVNATLTTDATYINISGFGDYRFRLSVAVVGISVST